jgi:hypothetical protein
MAGQQQHLALLAPCSHQHTLKREGQDKTTFCCCLTFQRNKPPSSKRQRWMSGDPPAYRSNAPTKGPAGPTMFQQSFRGTTEAQPYRRTPTLSNGSEEQDVRLAEPSASPARKGLRCAPLHASDPHRCIRIIPALRSIQSPSVDTSCCQSTSTDSRQSSENMVS